MNKIQKILDLTCQECQAVYQLLEIHEQKHSDCFCSTHWKQLLHQHFQEQIILHLAQEEAKAETTKDHDSK